MKKFIPKEKLGKKARKQLDTEQRSTWAFSPVTKKVESKKLYNRKRKAHDRYDDYGMGFSYPSIMMTFFSGSFFSSFLGMFRLSTPCSSFAPMSASVSASPT